MTEVFTPTHVDMMLRKLRENKCPPALYTMIVHRRQLGIADDSLEEIPIGSFHGRMLELMGEGHAMHMVRGWYLPDVIYD